MSSSLPARSVHDLPLWQYAAAILIPAVPFVVVFLRWTSLPNVATAPSFSDSVEMINAFLSSAAFAAVILTLLLQRRDLQEQSRQFHETMQLQVLTTYLSLVETRREIIASRPVIADDADIRTLHLAASIMLIGKTLDRVEVLLDRASILALDDEHAEVQRHGRQVRSLIARVATFDVARRQLEAENFSDGSLSQLRDWLTAMEADPAWSTANRVQLAEPIAELRAELDQIAALPPNSRATAPLSDLTRSLDGVRVSLIRQIRTALYNTPLPIAAGFP